MKTHEVKDRIQKKIVQRLKDNNGHGIIAAATGVGKTKVAIDYITSRKDTPSVLWLVPTTGLRDKGVPDEWNKWGQQAYFDKHVTTKCYRSLHKETSFYNIIVMDEGHNITYNAYNCETMRQKKYDSVIFLSATVPGERIKIRIINHMELKVIANIPVSQAEKLGLVAPFEVYAYPVAMGKRADFKVDSKYSGQKYTTSEHNRYYALAGRIAEFPRGKAPKNLYLARMRSIYRFKSKVRAAKLLLKQIEPTSRILIFCGSIEVADTLCEYTYHSKSDTSDYERFNRKEINRLAVVNALNEGHNMVDVDMAMMVQVNSKNRNYIQRQGRAIRWRPGHSAKIIILYSAGTVDYSWVMSSLKGMDTKKIHHQKVLHV